MEEFRANRLAARSILKLGFCAHLAWLMPLSLLFGIIGLFGGRTVNFNGQPVYGLGAIPAAILVGLILAAFQAALFTLGVLLLRLLRERAPRLRVRAPDQ